MRASSSLMIAAVCVLAVAFAGCEFTVVQNPPSSDDGDDMVAGGGVDTGDDTGDDDAGAGCSASTDLTAVYVNEASVEVIIKEGYYNGFGTLASGSTIVLREAGIFGDSTSKCITCDALTAGLRSVTFRTSPETFAPPPATLSKGVGYGCGDTISFTFHEDLSVSVDVD